MRSTTIPILLLCIRLAVVLASLAVTSQSEAACALLGFEMTSPSPTDPFARNSRGRQFFGTEYAKLDPLDLSITAEERFLRVASAYRFGGSDSQDWFYKWIVKNRPPPINDFGEDLAQNLFDIAYEFRFGTTQPSAPSSDWVERFDAAYKRDHNLVRVKANTAFVAAADALTKWGELSQTSRALPHSLHQLYLAALTNAERNLTRTCESGVWTTIHLGGFTPVTWPPPVETDFWN